MTLDKTNVILVGPTGSGKTLMAKTLARMARCARRVAPSTRAPSARARAHPTCARVLAARVARGQINVPLVIADATSLTQAGYVGDDVESILYKLYLEAGQDLVRTQRGIVYIDEVSARARAHAPLSRVVAHRLTRLRARARMFRSRATFRARACSKRC